MLTLCVLPTANDTAKAGNSSSKYGTSEARDAYILLKQETPRDEMWGILYTSR